MPNLKESGSLFDPIHSSWVMISHFSTSEGGKYECVARQAGNQAILGHSDAIRDRSSPRKMYAWHVFISLSVKYIDKTAILVYKYDN